ncbi:MAG: nitroreductase family protein [Bacteriovoracaceae bacterium]|jgi:nitroreductase|nr:nitroreductase family protein [Bacteriovoracaceae bacterium]
MEIEENTDANTETKKKTDSEWNEVEKVILNRRSVRRFRSKKVPDYLLRRILEAGRYAPSAGNCQPWRFIVLQNWEMIQEMSDILIKKMGPLEKIVNSTGLARDIAVSAIGLLKSQSMGDLRPFGATREVLAGRLKIFHDSPVVILVLKDTRGIDSPEFDTGLCSQNMVLAAHSLGLATCYIGFASFLKDKKWLRKMEISKPWEISTAICVGYPKFKPDGIVQRDMPQIDYYDQDGSKKILF